MFAQGVSRISGCVSRDVAHNYPLLTPKTRDLVPRKTCENSSWCALPNLCVKDKVLFFGFIRTQTVSEAAGQGVTITGDVHRNTWDWENSVIFASTIVTTIGSFWTCFQEIVTTWTSRFSSKYILLPDAEKKNYTPHLFFMLCCIFVYHEISAHSLQYFLNVFLQAF